MKNLKKRDQVLLGAGVALLVLVMVGTAVFFLQKKRSTEEYLIYWNVDREKYATSDTGISGRKADDDGAYSIRFMLNGEIVTYRAANKKIARQVDAKDLMGLKFDENGWIAEVIDVDEVTGAMPALNYYVEYMNDEELVANSSIYFSGREIKVAADGKVPFYDVSPDAKVVGEPLTSAVVQDVITAIRDKEGNITEVFLTKRSGNSGEASYCPHCEKDVIWKKWASDTIVPGGNGHWKLVTDINTLDQGRVAQDNVVVMDLNGHTITGNNDARVYCMNKANGTLAIIDLSKEQTGKIVTKGIVLDGACICLQQGKLELYGGVLDASRSMSTANGTAVYIYKGTTFDMYGGTIIGGTAQGFGGSVGVDGTFNMWGGTISGGMTEDGLESDVFIMKDAEFIQTGGEIKDTSVMIQDN